KEAARALIGERGWRGVTTRELAERAGVNEVTLFRQFGSKGHLLEVAVGEALQSFGEAIAEPSGDLRADLRRLAEGYLAFADRYPLLVARLLPDIGSEPEARASIGRRQQAFAARIGALFAHYRESGELVAEALGEAERAFMGGLLVRPLLGELFPSGGFDAAAYVERFLVGHEQTTARRNQPMRPACSS